MALPALVLNNRARECARQAPDLYYSVINSRYASRMNHKDLCRATSTHFPTPQREEPPRRKDGCRARVCRVHRCRWPAGFLKRTYRPAISPGDSSRESREVRSPERDGERRTDVTHHVADLRPPGQNLHDSRKPALRAGIKCRFRILIVRSQLCGHKPYIFHIFGCNFLGFWSLGFVMRQSCAL